MNAKIRIGLSANNDGAHTRELLDGLRFVCAQLELPPDYLWADDGRDPAIAAGAANQLADADAQIVVGHLSAAASLAAVEVYRKRNMALIAPATSHPQLNPTGYGGVLRAFGLDTHVAKSMIAETPPTRPPMILFQDQIYGLSLAAELEAALRAEGISAERHSLSDRRWLAQAARHRGAVYIAGIHEVSAKAVREIRRHAPNCRIALGDDCFTPNFITLCKGDAEGCTVSTPATPQFVKPISALEGKYGEKDGYFSTCAVAASVALQAVREAPGLRGAELGAMIRSRSWWTPFGQTAFDKNGNLRGMLYRSYLIRDGDFRQKVHDDSRVHGLA